MYLNAVISVFDGYQLINKLYISNIKVYNFYLQRTLVNFEIY